MPCVCLAGTLASHPRKEKTEKVFFSLGLAKQEALKGSSPTPTPNPLLEVWHRDDFNLLYCPLTDHVKCGKEKT